MKPTMLLAALALCACAVLAQDPTPPPAVPPAPIYVLPPAPAANDTWTWIVTYVIAPILMAAVPLVIALINSLKGRVDRQRENNEATRQQLVDVAKNVPPPAAPPAPPPAGPGPVAVIAFSAALALSGCLSVPSLPLPASAGKSVVRGQERATGLLTGWLDRIVDKIPAPPVRAGGKEGK